MNATKALLIANREKIAEAIRTAEMLAYKTPECEYRVYISDSGETEVEEWIAGSTGYIKVSYERNCIHIACHQYYDILFDWWWSNGETDVKEAFRARFGAELNTSPATEEGWPIDESILDNIYRQGRESGILPTKIDDWLDEEKEEAINDTLALTDIDAIIEEAIKYC